MNLPRFRSDIFENGAIIILKKYFLAFVAR